MFEQKPLICTPLTGKNTEEIIKELIAIVQKQPDLIEWRVDFFEQIAETDKVLFTAEQIFKNSTGIPLLFTIRSHKEGGESIPLAENEKVDLLCAVCETEFFELVDYEASNEIEYIKRLRDVSKQNGKKLILSYHNFDCTPDKSEILNRLQIAESYGADIAKAAVMPKDEKDVLALLEATKDAEASLNIPIITMSMGQLGAISRMLGWMYGSSVTFAVGEKSSAPGQLPIEKLRKVIDLVKETVSEN
ncbi:type I 3-dehydroquinate dehydratase [Metabacillus fastidiosus]|uniref:3-dehydroquinate dehydratase n=1 Tax=Metabacillus fastidiosus TaxID=1458 RepID=A0ABU6P2D4_9BACI|nr:type I 3-dehydroquinate dehydratase [Metabacillus fastidiosus]MED4403068.1 type I 3-dehydroquinate dehydratase [Metabacillus fastidiosus]MED4455298.1 type I 3-dehydroquinate dehydratase [Metabacillus fastidiosus]MED4461488.1 type I 3-dehydroquinate dehydratase [Metabacillus fastidiosus]